jgi:NitT/TauT family transport system substrate-binding protein
VKSDSQVYVATKDGIQKDGETLKRFLAGIRDAVAAMVADESFDETLKQLRAKYSFAALDDDKVAKDSMRTFRELWTGGDASKPLLVTEEAAWVAGYSELTAAGVAKSGGNAASWVDNSLLPA